MTALPAAFLDTPIAHRGLHDRGAGRIENSLSAIRAAVERGFGVELDLQVSADGAAMVFHDARLDRLTGETGEVRARDAAELGEITLTGSSDRIPTLEAVLAEVAGRVPLLLEIKDQDGALGENIGPLEAAVARALTDYAGPVAVMSFNPHSLEEMARLAPDIPRGLVTDPFLAADWPDLPQVVGDALREIGDYDRVGACFISHNATDLAAGPVARLKAAGAAVLCWTVRSAEAEAEARQVAGNITFEGYDPGAAAS